MRKYVTIDSNSGEVLNIMEWGDDRDFPSNIVIEEGQEVITVNVVEDVMPNDVYDSAANAFYILDITDNQLEIEDIKAQLTELELVLSEFQEATWIALMIDETNLPQVWQDRLLQKRELRARLTLLTA